MANGGAERAARTLAEGLAQRGHEVDLVLTSATGPRLEGISSGVRIVDLGAARVGAALPALVRYLRRQRPAALTSVLDHTNVLALCARRLARYQGRVIVVEQNTLSAAATNGTSRRDRMMPAIARHVFPWADFVVGVSEGVVDDLITLIGLPPDRVGVIFNPIVTAELFEMASAPVEHPWFNDGGPVLVAAGRMRPQKDFATLLRAVAAVRARRPVRLVILGDGPDRVALLALVDELGLAADVDLPGATDNPYAYMARATAFVLSSRWEGLPTVLVEALSCGVPIVSTDCPSGPREILDGGRYGVLVPVGDVELLAGGIDQVLDGAISVAPEESWLRYSVDTVVDRYLEVMIGTR